MLSQCSLSGGGGSGDGWAAEARGHMLEHHSHRTVVSRGAGESLSSAPAGVKPGAENWDLTVRRAVTSCFARLLLVHPVLLLVFIDEIIGRRKKRQRRPSANLESSALLFMLFPLCPQNISSVHTSQCIETRKCLYTIGTKLTLAYSLTLA